MRRTGAFPLILLALSGGTSIALVQTALASAGRPILTVPLTLPVALGAIGLIVISLAAPVRRSTRGRSVRAGVVASGARAVDPFYATRVVALAKACALGGALLTGAGIGAVSYLVTASASPPLGVIAPAIAIIVGAGVLLICGLVAESMCRVPPDDDEDSDEGRPLRATS